MRKVRITGSTHNSTWYLDQMGKCFYITDKDHVWSMDKNMGLYMVDGKKHPGMTGNGIIACDCVIVDEFEVPAELFEL
jgi:hypothetical protein